MSNAVKPAVNASCHIADLVTKIVQVHWDTMGDILTCDDTKSARLNAIINLQRQSEKMVAMAQRFESTFAEDDRLCRFKDTDFFTGEPT